MNTSTSSDKFIRLIDLPDDVRNNYFAPEWLTKEEYERRQRVQKDCECPFCKLEKEGKL